MAPKRRRTRGGKRSYSAKRKPARKVRKANPWAPRSATGSEVISALGGYALKRLKAKLGLNTETKFIDQDTGGISVPTSLAVSACQNIYPLIAQGLTDNTRSGNTVRMTRFALRGVITAAAGNVLFGSRVRIIVVNHGATPYNNASAADILEDPGNVDSEYTADPEFKSTVLYDRTFKFDAAGTGNGNSQSQVIEFDHRPLDHHIVWTSADTTGAQANVLRGFIAAWMIGTFTAGQAQLMRCYTRTEWVDN